MLRQAREERGYTQSQIADSTHILVQIIKGLEDEDFSGIVAPIYGRGFVKLYAEAVGLDPKQCIEAFMQAYNRKPAKVDAPPDGIEAKPMQNEEQPIITAFPQELPSLSTSHTPNQIDSVSTLSPNPPKCTPFSSRYVAPITKHFPTKKIAIPTYIWRLIIVLGVAIAVIYLATISIKALYKATCTKAPHEEQIEVPASNNPNTLPQAQIERKVEKLPDFYID